MKSSSAPAPKRRHPAIYRALERALILASLTAIVMIGFMLTAGLQAPNWPATITSLSGRLAGK